MVGKQSQFLDDRQKTEFYAGISKVDLDNYPHQEVVKIYEGAEILFYHYDAGKELVFDTVAICTGFTVTGKGMLASFIDRRTYEVFTVGDLPLNVPRLNIIAHAPPRCLLERTIKITKKCKRIQGMTATVIFRSRAEPREMREGVVQVISLTAARKVLGDAAFDRAASLAEREG